MPRQPETERLLAISARDRVFWDRPGCVLAGMDEVGRGPLAGPVVVCCAVMPPEPLVPYVNDSKKLSEKRRESVFAALAAHASAWSLSWVEPEVIDEINILEATRRGFERAFAAIGVPVTDVLIDAMTGLNLPARQHPLVHGDALSYSIAAASILAKVSRDRYVAEVLDKEYPQYQFAKHKGYGTKLHYQMLDEFGPCPEHRRTFLKKWEARR